MGRPCGRRPVGGPGWVPVGAGGGLGGSNVGMGHRGGPTPGRGGGVMVGVLVGITAAVVWWAGAGAERVLVGRYLGCPPVGGRVLLAVGGGPVPRSGQAACRSVALLERCHG